MVPANQNMINVLYSTESLKHRKGQSSPYSSNPTLLETNDNQEHKIIPRRTCISQQAAEGSTRAERTAVPVLISLELIHSLRGLPLQTAARAVGVSGTAFKKACRRLGMRRWEYRRGPGRAMRKCSTRSRIQSPAPQPPVGVHPAQTPRVKCRGPSAGEEVDAALSCVVTEAGAAWEFGLPDSERGEAEGCEADGAGADDALVLGMLRRTWPLDPAQN